MMLPKVVVTNRVHPQVLEFLESRCTVVANPDREPLPRQVLLRRAKDATALIAFMTDRVDDAFLAQCPDLRIIACALKGADNFDVEACTRRGVLLTVVPDLLTAPAAELAVGLMISLARHIVDGDRYVRSGAFRGWRPIFYGGTLDGSTVGLLGAGAVGKAIAKRLRGFGCTMLYHDEMSIAPDEEHRLGLERASFAELVGRSDFLVVAVPLVARTKHLIDAEVLGALKPGSYLVNISRGSVVDEEAVADALAEGRLGGYAADVFEMEDWARPDRPPSIAPRLLAPGARAVLTPHLGSAVDRIRLEIAMAAARSIMEFLDGRRPEGALNRPASSGTAVRRRKD